MDTPSEVAVCGHPAKQQEEWDLNSLSMTCKELRSWSNTGVSGKLDTRPMHVLFAPHAEKYHVAASDDSLPFMAPLYFD